MNLAFAIDRRLISDYPPGAVGSYAQLDGGGSDHLLLRVTVGAGALAATPAPGFRP